MMLTLISQQGFILFLLLNIFVRVCSLSLSFFFLAGFFLLLLRFSFSLLFFFLFQFSSEF